MCLQATGMDAGMAGNWAQVGTAVHLLEPGVCCASNSSARFLQGLCRLWQLQAPPGLLPLLLLPFVFRSQPAARICRRCVWACVAQNLLKGAFNARGSRCAAHHLCGHDLWLGGLLPVPRGH